MLAKRSAPAKRRLDALVGRACLRKIAKRRSQRPWLLRLLLVHVVREVLLKRIEVVRAGRLRVPRRVRLIHTADSDLVKRVPQSSPGIAARSGALRFERKRRTRNRECIQAAEITDVENITGVERTRCRNMLRLCALRVAAACCFKRRCRLGQRLVVWLRGGLTCDRGQRRPRFLRRIGSRRRRRRRRRRRLPMRRRKRGRRCPRSQVKPPRSQTTRR
mmetsp:Transcript_9380/g.24862  ORF Transcript_9380/g.24862 Transcript_9380/m.24862 type:complete len:218 (+) Transcript_9380:2866-3519(+)